MDEQESRLGEREAEQARRLDGALRDLAADPRIAEEWWREQARAIAGDDDAARRRRTAEYGPGGFIEVVRGPSLEGGQTFRVVRRDSVMCRTTQLPLAEKWLSDHGFRVVGHDDDARIGVSRLELKNREDIPEDPPADTERLINALRELRYRVPGSGEPRLCIGPDDITMEGMHAKGAGGAGPEQPLVPLGPRPEDGRGAGVIVAVVDGGFEQTDKLRTDGWMDHVVPPPQDAPLDMDEDQQLDLGAGHGTFVTGALLRVAAAATVLQYRALDSFGMGNTWRLKDCLLAAAEDGARIINLSLGFDDVDLLGSPALSAALMSLPPDVLVVAAAGNSGSPVPSLPAANHRCIAVGAVKVAEQPDGTDDLVPCAWSSFGPWVDFSCVGLGVHSTYVEEVAQTGTNPTRIWAGTSFAAPQISGLLAVELGRGRSAEAAVAAVRHQAQLQTGTPHPDFGHLLRVL